MTQARRLTQAPLDAKGGEEGGRTAKQEAKRSWSGNWEVKGATSSDEAELVTSVGTSCAAGGGLALVSKKGACGSYLGSIGK